MRNLLILQGFPARTSGNGRVEKHGTAFCDAENCADACCVRGAPKVYEVGVGGAALGRPMILGGPKCPATALVVDDPPHRVVIVVLLARVEARHAVQATAHVGHASLSATTDATAPVT